MPESGRPYESLVPLPEVISACVGFSTASKKVQGRYEMLAWKTWVPNLPYLRRGATVKISGQLERGLPWRREFGGCVQEKLYGNQALTESMER